MLDRSIDCDEHRMKTFNELLQEAYWHHKNRNFDRAANTYRELLRIKPGHSMLSDLLGRVRHEQGRLSEALQLFERACKQNPAEPAHPYNRGRVLLQEKRFAEAAEAFSRVCAINPAYEQSFSQFLRCSRTICDWSEYDIQRDTINKLITSDRTPLNPMMTLNYSDDPAAIRGCAEQFLAHQLKIAPPSSTFAPRIKTGDSGKIRIAYVSADYRDHAMTHLLSELFELHDRARFEVLGVSIGDKDKSPYRERIEHSFDRFIDAFDWPLTEIPAKLRALDIDILVDLHGHTNLNLIHIFASRPAPIQINYLGYPGTTGAHFLDYIIADPLIAPMDNADFFSEKIIHLPDCYQPNDRRRLIPESIPAKVDCGLPADGFVFAALNNCIKITPSIYDIWMRLLQSVPGSVLWIFASNEAAQNNLRKEAAARGIKAERVIFAPPVKHADHLARHRLADLFLDTFPYTGHTTVSDALWAGLPVVTCMGNSFASRVSASLITAAGLPELVTKSFEDYEQLSVSLARDRKRLGALRSRLQTNRNQCPLFDTPRYCGHLEKAYEAMVEINRKGEEPRSFAVNP